MGTQWVHGLSCSHVHYLSYLHNLDSFVLTQIMFECAGQYSTYCEKKKLQILEAILNKEQAPNTKQNAF